MSQFSRRDFLSTASAIGVTTSLSAPSLWAANANEEIGIGYISCGGRGGQLMSQFAGVSGINVTGLCDVDEKRLGLAQERFPKAHGYTDMREMLDAKDVDAVLISTCNHWHCLAAIWAMQAGKHVYVEKPLSAQPVGRQADGCGGAKIRSDLPDRDSAAIRSDAGGDQKVLAHRQGPGRDQVGACEPLRNPQVDRQTRHTAENRERSGLRPVARPGAGLADLSRQVALRLALGLEHRIGRNG